MVTVAIIKQRQLTMCLVLYSENGDESQVDHSFVIAGL